MNPRTRVQHDRMERGLDSLGIYLRTACRNQRQAVAKAAELELWDLHDHLLTGLTTTLDAIELLEQGPQKPLPGVGAGAVRDVETLGANGRRPSGPRAGDRR